MFWKRVCFVSSWSASWAMLLLGREGIGMLMFGAFRLLISDFGSFSTGAGSQS